MNTKAFILTTENKDPWAICEGTYLITGVKSKKEAIKAFRESGFPRGLDIKSVKQVKSVKRPKVVELQGQMTE